MDTKNNSLDLLIKLLNIDSKTRNVAGVNKVQSIVESQLKELGFQIKRHSNAEYGDLLVAEFKGMKKEFITMICHADTVFSPLTDNVHSELSDERLYGPGVIDDKGGICVILSAVKSFLKYNSSLIYGLRIVSSPNEEIGSVGFHEKFNELKKDSPIILGFEPSNEKGDIIVGRKGNRWYDIHVTGQKAHAGRTFEAGVNACGQLSSQLHEINKLTNLDKGITVNIGKISGGDTYNVVSDEAYGQLDIRFSTFEDRDHICGQVEELLEDSSFDANIKFNVVDDCPPFPKNNTTKNIINEYLDIIYELEGRRVSAISVGGASDCNHFSSSDSFIIDGLGPIGGGMHTDSEFIDLKSLRTRAEAVDKLLMRLQRV
ncbi:M20/M25/M40 family metallo-hydrolase [Bacteriovorax sp. Seq25_V]|uniref:M20/M25/M40 family metallo-hydrolase n=1 Tax=Bacteriovorax sp. Seq25_V TaxID=1201288 RepID=UPI00038A02DB|nr:M20/M25/M40 family metallo-hydrolase [Bacteriovorax sp. Seq25_V]EQC47286.1 peptidase dimerization domain protein [Bacteriovorax sp. Seq25_V]